MKKIIIVITIIFITLSFTQMNKILNSNDETIMISSVIEAKSGNNGNRVESESFCESKFNIQDKVHIQYEEESKEIDSIQFNIKTPMVKNLSNIKVEEKINKVIEKDIEHFKNNVMKVSNIDSKVKEINKDNYYASTEYKIMYQDENIISLLINYDYNIGEENWLQEKQAYNFHLKTGNAIKLNDLFDKTIDYEAIILEEIKKQVNREPDRYFAEIVNEKNSLDFNQKFYISDEGMVIFFNTYEIGPSISGVCEFNIPYEYIKEGVRENISGENNYAHVRSDYYVGKINETRCFIDKPVVDYLADEEFSNDINDIVEEIISSYENYLENMDNKKGFDIATITYDFKYVDKDLFTITLNFIGKKGEDIIKVEITRIEINTLHKSIKTDNNI